MFEMTRRVYCSQIGEGGVIRNSALVDILQDASNIHLTGHPVIAPYFREHGCVMFLISRQLDILRRPVLGEKLKVRTRVYELGRMYGFRNTFIYGDDGKPIVKCIAGGAFMNAVNGKPMRVEEELIEKVRVYPKLDMEYLPRKIALPKRKFDRCGDVAARRSDIDMNGHVNNARYLDLTDELVEGNREARRIRLEYCLPLVYAQQAQGVVWDEKDKTVVALRNAEGKNYCKVEYWY